jgi:CheY-like chemotaxis protein
VARWLLYASVQAASVANTSTEDMKIMEPHRKHVFVADDNQDFLDLLDTLLSDEGYRVTTCMLGTDSYRQIKELRPALVILDLKMPAVDGWQVLQTLKLDPETAQLPILVCSAAVAEVTAAQERLREQGCDVLLKPFNLDELLEKVESLTASSHDQCAGPA